MVSVLLKPHRERVWHQTHVRRVKHSQSELRVRPCQATTNWPHAGDFNTRFNCWLLQKEGAGARGCVALRLRPRWQACNPQNTHFCLRKYYNNCASWQSTIGFGGVFLSMCVCILVGLPAELRDVGNPSKWAAGGMSAWGRRKNKIDEKLNRC